MVLALRHHRRGERYVWIVPVTAFSWFGGGKQKGGKLPAPVTQRSRSRSRPAFDEKNRKDSSRSKASNTERPESWRIIDYVRPLAYRHDTTRAQDPGRAARRQESSRNQLNRQESQRGRTYRSDSQRTAVNRQDSQRTYVERKDSQRTYIDRKDSQRTYVDRKDSTRTYVDRKDSTRSKMTRQESQRERNHPYRQDSTRSQPRRQESQSRRLPQTAANEPTRNEAPTYVYWLPHKAPDQAHVRETRPRDNYRRDASPRR